MRKWIPLRLWVILVFTIFASVGTTWAQDGQAYRGKTGTKPVTFILRWNARGKVTGYYYPPTLPYTEYELTGTNYADGRLVLTETTGGKVSAVLRLRKSIRNKKVVWSGTMYNTDGRKIPVTFSR